MQIGAQPTRPMRLVSVVQLPRRHWEGSSAVTVPSLEAPTPGLKHSRAGQATQRLGAEIHEYVAVLRATRVCGDPGLNDSSTSSPVFQPETIPYLR
jgi:hypothetical protein